MDSGETPETAAGRELAEVLAGAHPEDPQFTASLQETGCRDIDVTPSNHVITHVSEKTQLCLHLFAKKVRPHRLYAHSTFHSCLARLAWNNCIPLKDP